MENIVPTGVGFQDAGVLSLLSGRRGGILGDDGDELLSAQAHADGTAVNTNVVRNSQQVTDLERARQVQDIRTDISNGNRDVQMQVQDALCNIRQDIAQAAKEAAECCCDAKLEAQKNTGDLRAEILAVESRGINRELERCERRLEGNDTTQAIVAAITNQTQVLSQMYAHGG